MKWCLRDFRFYELPAMECWLENMARKGWMIHTISGGNLFRFEKSEPQELRFSVKVIGNMSFLSAENCETAASYREYCEQAGWKFCCSNRVVQVFCAPAEKEPVPIETDPELEFQAVWKQTRKQILGQGLLALFWLFFALFTPSVESLLKGDLLNSRLLVLVLSFFFLADGIRSLLWYGKGRKALKEYREVPYYGGDGRKSFGTRMMYLEIVCIFVFLFYLFGITRNSGFKEGLYRFLYFVFYLVFIFVLQTLIRKRGFRKRTYAGIVVVGALVLTFSLMGIRSLIQNSAIPEPLLTTGEKEEWVFTEIDLGLPKASEDVLFTSSDHSFLGEMQEYRVYLNDFYLSYTFYETRFELLQEKLRKELLTPYKTEYADVYRIYTAEPTEPIGTVAVSRVCEEYCLRETGEVVETNIRGYLLETEGKLLYLSFSGSISMTEEEILKLAAEKL